jgi:hypothetical protein
MNSVHYFCDSTKLNDYSIQEIKGKGRQAGAHT